MLVRRVGAVAVLLITMLLGSCNSLEPVSRVAGTWLGTYGNDDVREVLVIVVDAAGRLHGHAYFETRSTPRESDRSEAGDGAILGQVDGDSVAFTLSRGGTDYRWSGVVDASGRLAGTFDGYSNDATYVRVIDGDADWRRR